MAAFPGELLESAIPSAAVLSFATDQLKTQRKTIVGFYTNNPGGGRMFSHITHASPLPDKAKFLTTILSHVLGRQIWVLGLPRSSHADYAKYCTRGNGTTKKERAHQFVTAAADLLKCLIEVIGLDIDLQSVTSGDFREILEALEEDIQYTPVQQLQAHKHLFDLSKGEDLFSRTNGFKDPNEQNRTTDFIKRLKYALAIGKFVVHRRGADDNSCPWYTSLITIEQAQNTRTGIKYPEFIRNDSSFLTLVQGKETFLELFACLSSRAATRADASAPTNTTTDPFLTDPAVGGGRSIQQQNAFHVKEQKKQNKYFKLHDDGCLYGVAKGDMYQCKTCVAQSPHLTKEEKSHLMYDDKHCRHYSTDGGNGKWISTGRGRGSGGRGRGTKRPSNFGNGQPSKRQTKPNWQADFACRNKPCTTPGCKFKHSGGQKQQQQQPQPEPDANVQAQMLAMLTKMSKRLDVLDGGDGE